MEGEAIEQPWETSKENVQPLKRGRDTKALNAALLQTHKESKDKQTDRRRCAKIDPRRTCTSKTRLDEC